MNDSPIRASFAAARHLGFLCQTLSLLGGVLAAAQPAPLGPPPGVVIAATPDPQKVFVFSPSLAILPDGSFVASMTGRISNRMACHCLPAYPETAVALPIN